MSVPIALLVETFPAKLAFETLCLQVVAHVVVHIPHTSSPHFVAEQASEQLPLTACSRTSPHLARVELFQSFSVIGHVFVGRYRDLLFFRTGLNLLVIGRLTELLRLHSDRIDVPLLYTQSVTLKHVLYDALVIFSPQVRFALHELFDDRQYGQFAELYGEYAALITTFKLILTDSLCLHHFYNICYLK